MQFDYLYSMQATGSLEIEDVGNCAIIATTGLFQEYILIIKTEGGDTQILQYGPQWVEEDMPILSDVSCTYSRFQYNQRKIERYIDTWLNSKTIAQQAIAVTIEEAKEHLKDMRTFV